MYLAILIDILAAKQTSTFVYYLFYEFKFYGFHRHGIQLKAQCFKEFEKFLDKLDPETFAINRNIIGNWWWVSLCFLLLAGLVVQ